MDSPYWKGPLPGVDVQRRYLWKTFRGKPTSIPGSARKCSASARNPVRLHPGMLFGFSPESCSTCPGMLFGLPRNTHLDECTFRFNRRGSPTRGRPLYGKPLAPNWSGSEEESKIPITDFVFRN